MLYWLLHMVPGSRHNESGFCEQLAYHSLLPFGCDISIVDIAIQNRLIYEDVDSSGPEICGYCNVLPCVWHILLLSRLEISRRSFQKCSAHTEAAALPSNGISP